MPFLDQTYSQLITLMSQLINGMAAFMMARLEKEGSRTSCVASEAPHEEAHKRRSTQKKLVVGRTEGATHQKRKRCGCSRGHQFHWGVFFHVGVQKHTLFVNEGTSFVKLVP